MSELQALTQAQKDAMSIHAQKWIGIGRSAGATNRAIVEPIITDFYQQIGKDAPKFIYAQSPMAGLLIANLVKGASVWSGVMENSVSDSVCAGVWSSVNASDWSSVSVDASIGVSASIEASVYASVRSSLMASVRASVSDDVRFGVWSGVMDSVSDSVWSSVNASVSASELQYHQFFYGSHDIDWLAFYSYFSEYVKNDIYTDEQKRALQQWIDLNANCGWWYPFVGVCVICDRPEYTLVDESSRLHSYSSPAIRYTDGFEIYAVNGEVRRVID